MLWLLLLCSTTVYGQLQMTRLSYTKLPYTTNNNFGLLRNAAHRAAYHAPERLLYVIGAQTAANEPRLLHIIDMNQPNNPQVIHVHSFDPVINGKANDIVACADTIAVSLDSSLATKEGHVELFVPFKRGNTALTGLGREAVGVDPKGMAFTDDCQKLIVANEGRGGLDVGSQTFVDPRGSVTVINRNDIGNPAIVTIDFGTFLAGREAEYQARGVRWVYQGNHNAGIVNEMADDLEPERVAISSNQRFAYVSLPENNAVARIDINTYTVSEIFPLGYKNWTTIDGDFSDQDGGPNFVRHPVYSMYQATDVGIGVFNMQEYLITANQGAIKRYTSAQGDAFDESKRARQIALDSEYDESMWTADMSAAVRNNQILGRMQVRYSDSFDQISRLIKDVKTYGGRSVSLWLTSTMGLAIDTRDELELTENAKYPSTFNGEASNGNQSPQQQRDLRSDDFGPEPTSLAVDTFENIPFVAIGTRTGLVHLYLDELLVPVHQGVFREGQITQPWNTLYQNDEAGDAIITDIGIINSVESPNGQTLVYVIGSATGSVGVYQVSRP